MDLHDAERRSRRWAQCHRSTHRPAGRRSLRPAFLRAWSGHGYWRSHPDNQHRQANRQRTGCSVASAVGACCDSGRSAVSGARRCGRSQRNVAEVGGVQPFWQEQPPNAVCTGTSIGVGGTVIAIGEGNVGKPFGGTRDWFAFLTLSNMETEPQTATVILNVDGLAAPLQFTRTVPGCGSVVVGIHTVPGVPPSANFRTQVGWPGAGSAGLIMRPSGSEFGVVVVMPPVAVLR